MPANRRLFLTSLSASLGALTLSPPARAADTERLPLTLSENGLLLPVRIKNRDLIALFDCGATRSLVDSQVAIELGLRARSAMKVNLVYDTGRLAITGPVRVRIGEAVFTPSLAIGELRSNGRPFDILLGCDLLDAFRLELDIATRHAILSADRAGDIPPGMTAVALETSVNGLTVDLLVEGKTLRAHVDTGSNDALTIRRSWAETNGLMDDRPVSQWISADLSGIYKVDMISARTVSLGGYEFGHVPAGVAEFQQDADATIGVELLMRCRSVWSLAQSRLWLSATPDEVRRPFSRERAGLAYLPEAEGLRVIFVAPGSPADKAGWQAGEVITAVDGVTLKAADANSWKRDPARSKARLTLACGETRELVLGDYY